MEGASAENNEIVVGELLSNLEDCPECQGLEHEADQSALPMPHHLLCGADFCVKQWSHCDTWHPDKSYS